MSALHQLTLAGKLAAKNIKRGLTGQGDAPPIDHTAFEHAARHALEQMPKGLVHRSSIFLLPANEAPWRNTGLDLKKGDVVTTLAVGRVTLSRLFDIWSGPAFQLWGRLGEDGTIFKGTRDTNSFEADRTGRLFLGGVNPGFWSDDKGNLGVPKEAYNAGRGAISVAVIIWRGDHSGGLSALLKASADSPLEPLVAGEIDRLENFKQAPEGWSQLWEIGQNEIYHDCEADLGGPAICCATHRDVGILQKDVSLPLSADIRLLWDWKVDQLPSLYAEDTVPTHDYMSIAVEFDNGRDLTYYWSAELPVGTHYHCPLPNWSHRETHMVIRSGQQGLGQWYTEDRNIMHDYKLAVGEPPAQIVRVWLIAVSMFQRRTGECQFSNIKFLSNDGETSVQ